MITSVIFYFLACFKMFDGDKDNYLSREELTNMVTLLCDICGQYEDNVSLTIIIFYILTLNVPLDWKLFVICYVDVSSLVFLTLFLTGFFEHIYHREGPVDPHLQT